MAVIYPSINFYDDFMLALLNGEIPDFAAAQHKISLHTSSYTPTKAHANQDDLTNEIANGDGYTTGGLAISGLSVAKVAAADLTPWAANTDCRFGQVRRPTAANGHAYMCIAAGTSHAMTEPTWPTGHRATVTDGTVVWAEIGSAVIAVTISTPTKWEDVIKGDVRYAVWYVSVGEAAENPLFAWLDFLETQTLDSQDLTITWAEPIVFPLP
jgi:hypothetical protein